MIYTHLFSVEIQWMTFMRIFMTNTHTDREKTLIVFDDIIADIMSNKTFQGIIKELFIR